MLVWCWHMFVNVGCELCSSEAVSYIILHYFSALSPIWSISFLLLLDESESLSAKGVNTNFLFDYAVLYFCCNLGTAPSRRTRRDSARFIKTSHATANGIHKADTVVFDVCQSKWTINAKYKHSSMLISLLGSLMAPVGSVKCVLKNCIGKAIQPARIKAYSLVVPFQPGGSFAKMVICSGGKLEHKQGTE